MLQSIRKAFQVREIRNRILFTILVVILIRIGCQIPLPGTDHAVLQNLFGDMSASGFDFFNAMTGSSFSNMSIFALNITVYITATIIMQLLTIAIPRLEELQKEGENGRMQIAKVTRFLTIGLAIAESIFFVIGFGRQGIFGSTEGLPHIALLACNAMILTAGAVLVMWLGEQITDKGIGNGISIILLANIVSSMPRDFYNLYQQFIKGASSIGMAVLAAAIIVAVVLAVITFIVYLNDGERRIAIQYSQKGAGQRFYSARSSHIPLKVNTAGVIPIIFAASLFQFPVIIASFVSKGSAPAWTKFFTTSSWCDPSQPVYTLGLLLYIALIIFFAYFYTQITFNPAEVAGNLKRQGGSIPGVRSGRPTEAYLKNILKYLIFIGAVGLIIIAIIPMIVSGVFHATLSFAGTSMIIVVGVILETAKKLESLLLVRNYDGFLYKAS